MRRTTAVPAAQWKRGLEASRRIGEWLTCWEERARALKEGDELPPRPSLRRRRSPGSSAGK